MSELKITAKAIIEEIKDLEIDKAITTINAHLEFEAPYLGARPDAVVRTVEGGAPGSVARYCIAWNLPSCKRTYAHTLEAVVECLWNTSIL